MGIQAAGGGTADQGVVQAPPRRWRLGLRRILRPAFLLPALAAASLLGFGIGFLSFADEATRSYDQASPRTEAIAVMTGGSYRVNDAVSLLGSGHGRRLLISGVNPVVGEREFARAVPAATSLMACCIDLDHRALNTRGNAIETARWVRLHAFRSVMVVTSGYHMPRTMLELQHLLPDIRLVPYPVQTGAIQTNGWWKDGQSLKILGSEYAKYLLAALGLRLDAPLDERPRPLRTRTASN